MGKPICWPIAETPDKKTVHIKDAKRGEGYYCLECSEPLKARLGEHNAHHFSHYPGYSGICTGESRFHRLAKHLLAYHFKLAGQISIQSKCASCDREYTEYKKIFNVVVEPEHDDYRPDVRLFVEGDLTIDCEIVYKNPIVGDKLNTYKDKNANLLVWFIKGQTEQLPELYQCDWLELDKHKRLITGKEKTEKLLFLTSPLPPQHTCSQYGIAYIADISCYKCKGKTKVAILSNWYPKWQEPESGGSLGGEESIEYQSNVHFNSVPTSFISQLNKKYFTNLRDDYSFTLREHYLMNHCHICGAKFGDGYLIDGIFEDMADNPDYMPFKRVEIPITLTNWENRKVSDWQKRKTL